MNVENINKVADAIEQHSIATLGFNMHWFRSSINDDKSGHKCQTTACVGGWTLAVLDPTEWEERPHNAQRAADLLELGEFDRDKLFFPVLDYDAASPREAVAVLRHLAKTGMVDWRVKPESDSHA